MREYTLKEGKANPKQKYGPPLEYLRKTSELFTNRIYSRAHACRPPVTRTMSSLIFTPSTNSRPSHPLSPSVPSGSPPPAGQREGRNRHGSCLMMLPAVVYSRLGGVIFYFSRCFHLGIGLRL